MSASRGNIIDGAGYAAALRERLASHVAALKASTGKIPGLTVVIVGDDPASQVYVKSKGEQTQAIGMEIAGQSVCPTRPSEDELLSIIDDLNRNENVNGYIGAVALAETHVVAESDRHH